MRKDPTEFRERFKRWQAGEKVYDGGKPIQYIYDKVDKSNADFAKRLRDPNRKSIPDWQDPNYNATHKLSVGTDYNGNHYIYPEVQNVRGILKDYTNPKNQMRKFGDATGMVSAEMRGDTIHVNSIDDGIKFTLEYKSYYPGFDKGKALPAYNMGTPEDNSWLPKDYKTPQNSEPVSAKPTTTYIGDNNLPHLTDPVYQEPINPQTGRPYTVYELDKPLSGTDPLAAFIVENYVGGKVLSGIGTLLKPAIKGIKNMISPTIVKNSENLADLVPNKIKLPLTSSATAGFIGAANSSLRGDDTETILKNAERDALFGLGLGVYGTGYFYTPKTSTGKLIKDVIYHPFSVRTARKNGQYPLTFSERKQYLKNLESTTQEVKDLLNSDYRRFFEKQTGMKLSEKNNIIPEDIKIISGGDKIMSRLKVDNGTNGVYNYITNTIRLRRRKRGSLLPVSGGGYKGVLGHELQHAVLDNSGLELALMDGVYYSNNPNSKFSHIFKPLETNVLGYPRKGWSASPLEVDSELKNIRMQIGTNDNPMPSYNDFSKTNKLNTSLWFSYRFGKDPITMHKMLKQLSDQGF